MTLIQKMFISLCLKVAKYNNNRNNFTRAEYFIKVAEQNINLLKNH